MTVGLVVSVFEKKGYHRWNIEGGWLQDEYQDQHTDSRKSCVGYLVVCVCLCLNTDTTMHTKIIYEYTLHV